MRQVWNDERSVNLGLQKASEVEGAVELLCGNSLCRLVKEKTLFSQGVQLCHVRRIAPQSFDSGETLIVGHSELEQNVP